MIARPALALLLGLAGCAVSDPVAVRSCPGCLPDGPCADPVPLQLRTGAGAPLCGDALAQHAFSRALCHCAPYAGPASLRVTSYSGDPAQTAAAFHRGVDTPGSLDLDGALLVADAAGLRFGATLRVGATLRAGGPLGNGAGAASVTGDASVAGAVRLTDLTVGGSLILPSGAELTVTGRSQLGALRRESVPAPPSPCPCDPQGDLDLNAALTELRASNDNLRAGVDPDQLSAFGAAATTLQLRCGRYFLRRVAGEGPLRVLASGRVVLAVAEGLNLREELLVEVQPGGELDLLIGGLVQLSGPLTLRAPEPQQLRVFLSGSDAFLSARALIVGHVYGPRLALALSSTSEVAGTLTIGEVRHGSELILRQGPLPSLRGCAGN